jgi:hypothetical protein
MNNINEQSLSHIPELKPDGLPHFHNLNSDELPQIGEEINGINCW